MFSIKFSLLEMIVFGRHAEKYNNKSTQLEMMFIKWNYVHYYDWILWLEKSHYCSDDIMMILEVIEKETWNRHCFLLVIISHDESFLFHENRSCNHRSKTARQTWLPMSVKLMKNEIWFLFFDIRFLRYLFRLLLYRTTDWVVKSLLLLFLMIIRPYEKMVDERERENDRIDVDSRFVCYLLIFFLFLLFWNLQLVWLHRQQWHIPQLGETPASQTKQLKLIEKENERKRESEREREKNSLRFSSKFLASFFLFVFLLL
jgi:hypothetical protein